VLRVVDTEIVPIVPVPGNFDKSSVGALREVPGPITMQQPLGPGFRLDGQAVSWQKWSFHFRIDRRGGLILNNVGYQDGDWLRSILYEASLSEIFVPYMDPDEHWYAKSYLMAANSATCFRLHGTGRVSKECRLLRPDVRRLEIECEAQTAGCLLV
jgi:primary-amine oxidase